MEKTAQCCSEDSRNDREDASMGGLKVLIVGGGIGGITAMLALRQRGIDVQLFEQTAAFDR
jgi:cation diffusion facilitator CzcD-associated flavoprotein CzcO